MNREDWLMAFTEKSRRHFKALAEVEIPAKVRMSVGFTSRGQRSKAIGECWNCTCSEDGTFEIFVVPGLETVEDIAATLTHELIHAAVGLDQKHGGNFRRVAIALGLEGKMTATTAGDKWREWAQPILDELGPMPGAKLSGQSSAKPKQGTRMLKCECPECGFIFRAAGKWVCEGQELRCPNPECEGKVVVHE